MSNDESGPPEAVGGAAELKRPVIMPDVYNGDDEWRDWLLQFESCADLNGWDDPTKCKFIFVRLKGTAGRALSDLDDATKANWTTLKGELTKRFDTTTRPDLYKSEFMGRKKKGSETYLELGNAIRTLARKAYPSLSNIVRDELAKDQFLRALDKPELALRVRHANPKTLDEAIRMALEWEAVEKDVTGKYGPSDKTTMATVQEDQGACASVGKQDKTEQLLDMMTEMLKIMKEDREQHKQRRGREERGQPSYAGDNKCWNCNGRGHISKNCPQPNSRKCYNCGKSGHISRSCPEPRKSGN